MKLAVAVGDVGQAPKVENLARSEGIGCGGELAGEADTAIWGVPLAPTTRRVAPATVESESHLTMPLPSALAIAGSESWQALLFESVSEYGSLVTRVDSRTQESQRGHDDLSWFRPIGALRLVVDDPYTQKHSKLEGYNRVVERFGRGG
jgi:hypothetical protein